MKFLSILYVNFFWLSNPIFAEKMPSKTDILKKSYECLQVPTMQACRKLIVDLEKLQLIEFERNRFKCQSSLLGLQTEVVEAHFFENIPKSQNRIMAPYVIKNC